MKLFRFESAETNYSKCGHCNWEATYLYWMSDTEENARREIAEMGENGNALCGSCMCDVLAEEKYDITASQPRVNCDGGVQCCDTAYVYELYWDGDKEWHEESNNSCIISAKICPDDFLRLMHDYFDKYPDNHDVEDFLEYLNCHSVWTQILVPDHSFNFGKGQ